MSFRRTKGIVSDSATSDAAREADVIMTSALLGLAVDYISTHKKPIQFDMDPLDKVDDPEKFNFFKATITKVDNVLNTYMAAKNLVPASAHAGLSPGYWPGAMIAGVYSLAGQATPGRSGPATGVISPPLTAPVLSTKGKALWEKIVAVSPDVPQYTGEGAYTGFVDNKNTSGNTDPVGPRSTFRFNVPQPVPGAPSPVTLHQRWLPPDASPLWAARTRKGQTTHVPWGLIGGNLAGSAPSPGTKTTATNLADEITADMRDKYGMVFHAEPQPTDIAAYTHGLVQAIYKAYVLGPNCQPYEIAVGDKTKKMASCLGCTLFMYATGYPPTSIHLGSALSWAPLYVPDNPNGPTDPHEVAVIRDLNNAWNAKVLRWINIGLSALDDAHITADHKAARDATRAYLAANESKDPASGAGILLDALTVHDTEIKRLGRTLQ